RRQKSYPAWSGVSAACDWPGFQTQRQYRAAIARGISARQWNWASWLRVGLQFEPGPRLGLDGPLLFPAGFFSGFTKAITVPGEMPLRIARPSLTARTLTSCISKLRLRLQYTTFFPSCSKTAPPGMETARERLSPRMFRR